MNCFTWEKKKKKLVDKQRLHHSQGQGVERTEHSGPNQKIGPSLPKSTFAPQRIKKNEKTIRQVFTVF